jgi:hypothetical protein
VHLNSDIPMPEDTGSVVGDFAATAQKARGELRADVDSDLAVDLMVGPMIYRLIIAGGEASGLGDPAEVLEAVLAGLRPR